MTYAGIGSRKTPKPVLDFMELLGEHFALMGLTLRSGAAPGADTAFETGCIAANGQKEIFIPWHGFGDRVGEDYLRINNPAAIDLAKEFHPAWNSLTDGGKKLQIRNGFQVLGPDLESPSDFIVCWTPPDKPGGTGQAIRIAEAHNIPVYNLAKPGDLFVIQELLALPQNWPLGAGEQSLFEGDL